ncbi:MAG TPA: hypothetical protein DEA43_04210 [Candidatus Moranbacteria bacterium]|nr:hypothetical protein [Candidatus Moranbacteria bacterium]HBT46057.1 hypothetical protein [Candidatus Moranbacteria bacterium]
MEEQQQENKKYLFLHRKIEKLAHVSFFLYILYVLVAGAKTSLFAKIYTSLRYVSKFLNAHHSSFAYALRNVQNIKKKA